MKLFRSFGAVLLFSLAIRAFATESDDAKVRVHLDGLRGIHVTKDKAKIAELNKRMDDAWAFIRSHPNSLPMVEEELRKELATKEPDQFFIMDVGFLVVVEEGDKGAGLAVAALERVDSASDIIHANWEELFHFSMKLGATGKETERYLRQMDRIYLPNQTEIDFFRAPHVVKLTALDIQCMVYGVAGETSARHLAALLKEGNRQEQIIQILRGVGSEPDTPAVQAVMNGSTDYQTIATCISFLMEVGGPSGRVAVKALDTQKKDHKTKAYYKKLQPEIEKVNFESIVSALAETEREKTSMTDEQLQRLLDAMEENDGADDETPPSGVAKSGIPADKLLAQMKRIRTRSFRRETNHVFEDLPIANMLINALQYKMAKP